MYFPDPYSRFDHDNSTLHHNNKCMKIQSRLYVSFLLRMWQVDEAGELVWRASLENPRNGKIFFFATLFSLFQFLEKGEGMGDAGSAPPKGGEDND